MAKRRLPKDEPREFLAPAPPGALGAIPAPAPRRQPGLWERMFGPPELVARPTPAPRPAAAPARPAAPAWRAAPAVDLSRILNTKVLFDHVQGLRRQPGWTAPVSVPLETILAPTADPLQASLQVGRYLGLSEAEVLPLGQNAWRYVIEPKLRQFEQALNATKPADLPGVFRTDFANDGSLILGYHEQ